VAWTLPPGASVRCLGPRIPAEVAQQMRDADLLVLPSRGEGFPLVVQEALACGTPVLVSEEVASAFPRRDARCVHGVALTGEPAEDTRRLRTVLEQLAADPGALRAAREAAVALSQQWSWRQCVADYLPLYRALAPAGRAVPPERA
jgi:glycosyltransferase involved in cell wall biosynthesis